MFSNIQINPHFHQRKAYLSWEFSGPYDRFVIQKSVLPTTGFTTAGTSEEPVFVDDELYPLENEHHNFYKIIAVSSGKRFDSFPVSWNTNPTRDIYGAAAAIIYQEHRALQRNTKVGLYKKLKTGERCSSCMDVETGQLKSASLCTACYGTGFVGGYRPPFSGVARNVTTTEGSHQHTALGKSSKEKVAWRLIMYPVMTMGDLIFDKDSFVLYEVDDTKIYKYAGKIPTAQEVTTSQIPRDDVRHALLESHD